MLGAFAIGLLCMLIISVPVGVALILLGAFGVWGAGVPLTIVAQRLSFGLDSFILVAIPLFLLMGNLMNASGVTHRIFDFASALVGHWRGGLAQVNILASVVFAGMSGSALADAAGLGTVEIRAMIRAGYRPAQAAAISAASSTIGPILPPSIAAVLYSFIANVSVGRMFLAGIVPGLMMAATLMVTIYLQSRGKRYPSLPPAESVVRRRAFSRALLALVTPVLLIGGMRTGIFTPTEVAAVAVAYSLLLSILYRAQVRLSDIIQALRETALTTGAIMIIVAGAHVFVWILAREQLPQQLTQLVISMNMETWQLLLVVNTIVLIFGMMVDTTAIMLLLVPVIVPALTAVGVDPIHLGVVLIVNMMIGLITPPVGMALFIVSKISGSSLGEVGRECLPYVAALLLVLVLITYIPGLVLGLPNFVYGVQIR